MAIARMREMLSRENLARQYSRLQDFTRPEGKRLQGRDRLVVNAGRTAGGVLGAGTGAAAGVSLGAAWGALSTFDLSATTLAKQKVTIPGHEVEIEVPLPRRDRQDIDAMRSIFRSRPRESTTQTVKIPDREVEIEVSHFKVPEIVKTAAWGLGAAALAQYFGITPEHWPYLHSVGQYLSQNVANLHVTGVPDPLLHSFAAGVALRGAKNVALSGGVLGLVGLGGGGYVGGKLGARATRAALRR